jgi:hypothetical protein
MYKHYFILLFKCNNNNINTFIRLLSWELNITSTYTSSITAYFTITGIQLTLGWLQFVSKWWDIAINGLELL